MSAAKYSVPLWIVIVLAGWIGAAPAGHAAPSVQQNPTPTLAPTLAPTSTPTSTPTSPSTSASTSGAPVAGRLRFADNDAAPTGSFDLQIDALRPPGSGSHYELWLRSAAGELLDLGALPSSRGRINFAGDTEEALLANYDAALVSLEPEDDPDAEISQQIVLSGTLPASLLAPIRQLFFDGRSRDKGPLFGAAEQAKVVASHGGFLQEALAANDMTQAHRHAEHIVNALVGESGLLYSDWDRDGQPQNPGDGYGVLVYLEDLQQQTGILSGTVAAGPDAGRLLPLVRQIMAAAEESHELGTLATEGALQIFAADTSEEAQGFADELADLATTNQETSDAAYRAGLELAEFRLTATPAGLAQPATVTQAQTPTTSLLTPTVTTGTVTTGTAGTGAGARPGGTLSGTNWINEADGGVYVYVPGGAFTMGAEAAEAITEQEQPAHEVVVDGFWMQQTEVTNAQYARCVADGACTPPQTEGWDAPELAEHPVSHVDWEQANAYARWAGGRLPTEAEWEKACRSDDGRLYPWGNEPPTPELANFANNVGETVPVGSFPDGASPYGILDLSGNVWEWTSSHERPYPYVADNGREDTASGAEDKRTARGGSFYYTQYQLRCTSRSGFNPTTANPNFGLRVLMQQANVTIVNEADGGVYVYVPGGAFTMGAEAAEAITEQEQPAHEVVVDGFWMQQTEVTNAQYARCVADGACTPPQTEGWDAPELAEHPVSHVDWEQANAYARWAGGRLPTEAEWEKACRSDDGRLYPWGNEPPTPELANFANNVGETVPVGSFPDGASPYGILDLSGNVWEWTSSHERPYPYVADNGREDTASGAEDKRTARGGSFYYTQYQLRCTSRSGFAPTTANPNFGLRVLMQQAE